MNNTQEIILGTVGIVPGKEWDETKSYNILTAVSRNGSSYLSLKESVGIDPETDTDESFWMLIASRGESWYDLCVRTGRFEGTEEEFLDEKQAQIDEAKKAVELANEAKGQLDSMLDSVTKANEEMKLSEAERVKAESSRKVAEEKRALSETSRNSTFDSKIKAVDSAIESVNKALEDIGQGGISGTSGSDIFTISLEDLTNISTENYNALEAAIREKKSIFVIVQDSEVNDTYRPVTNASAGSGSIYMNFMGGNTVYTYNGSPGSGTVRQKVLATEDFATEKASGFSVLNYETTYDTVTGGNHYEIASVWNGRNFVTLKFSETDSVSFVINKSTLGMVKFENEKNLFKRSDTETYCYLVAQQQENGAIWLTVEEADMTDFKGSDGVSALIYKNTITLNVIPEANLPFSVNSTDFNKPALSGDSFICFAKGASDVSEVAGKSWVLACEYNGGISAHVVTAIETVSEGPRHWDFATELKPQKQNAGVVDVLKIGDIIEGIDFGNIDGDAIVLGITKFSDKRIYNVGLLDNGLTFLKITVSNDGYTNWTMVAAAPDYSLNQKADKISVIDHFASDTTFALTPNVFHKWSEVASLTLTLEAGERYMLAEYMFEFVSGETPTVLTLPETVKWASANTVEASKTYQVRITNGMATMIGA